MKSTYVRTQAYGQSLGVVRKKMIPTPVLAGTNNFCLFKTLNPGCSWDQDPTFAISIHNSLICYIFFFCQETQLKKNPNNFASSAVPQQQYNCNSVQICPTYPILTDRVKTLFLLPCSTIAPLAAKPLALTQLGYVRHWLQRRIHLL